MEEQKMTENLEELKEIGKEIKALEKKLEAVPDVEQLDPTKYNRKQRRQLQRQMVKAEKEKQQNIEQKANTFVTRREFVGMFQSMQKIRDRMFYIDVLTGVMEKLLISKSILTEEEIKEHIQIESEKALAFQEIQKGEKDYENRLKRCLELQVDPRISNIGPQIYEDPDLDINEKLRLAKEYNLEMLLKTLEAQLGQAQSNEILEQIENTKNMNS